MQSRPFFYSTAFVVGMIGNACVTDRANPDHCSSNEGDVYCAERFPDRPLCNDGTTSECSILDLGQEIARYGCVAPEELRPGCHDACGTLDTDECLGGSDTSGTAGDDVADGATATDGSMSGGMTDDTGTATDDGTGTTDGGGCTDDEDCADPGSPFCLATSCVSCSDTIDPNAACASLDAGTPLCVASECVQCTVDDDAACTGTTPVCDPDTNTCVGCTEHEHCPDSACYIPSRIPGRESDDDGACFDPQAVRHVDGDGGRDHTTIGAAVSAVAAGQEGVIIVHAWSGEYNQAVTVSGGKRLAILAADGEEPNWIQGNNMAGPQLSVTGTNTIVFLDRMRLASNADTDDPAVRINAGRLHAQRSRIVQNSGGGISVQSSGALDLENGFVGYGGSTRAALVVTSASAYVLYSSLASGFDNFSDVYAVACTTPTSFEIRNSFLASFDNVGADISCSDATVSYTASQVAIAGAGNQALGPVGATWFQDINSGNFLLDSPPVALGTTASWQTGDPAVDIDSDSRPSTDGAPDYAGADVP